MKSFYCFIVLNISITFQISNPILSWYETVKKVFELHSEKKKTTIIWADVQTRLFADWDILKGLWFAAFGVEGKEPASHTWKGELCGKWTDTEWRKDAREWESSHYNRWKGERLCRFKCPVALLIPPPSQHCAMQTLAPDECCVGFL